jgi:hypothetical protein
MPTLPARAHPVNRHAALAFTFTVALCLPAGLLAGDEDPLAAAREALAKKRQAYERDLAAKVEDAKDAVKKANYFVPAYADPAVGRARNAKVKKAREDLAAAEAKQADFRKNPVIPIDPLNLVKGKVGDFGTLLDGKGRLDVRTILGSDEMVVTLYHFAVPPTPIVTPNQGVVYTGGSDAWRSEPFILKGLTTKDYATGSAITEDMNIWVITGTRRIQGDRTAFVVEREETLPVPPPAPVPPAAPAQAPASRAIKPL